MFVSECWRHRLTRHFDDAFDESTLAEKFYSGHERLRACLCTVDATAPVHKKDPPKAAKAVIWTNPINSVVGLFGC